MSLVSNLRQIIRLENTSISIKLPVFIVVAAVLSALAAGSIAFTKITMELETAAKDKLVSLRDGRKLALVDYFRTISLDLRILAERDDIQDAVLTFSTAFNSAGNYKEGEDPSEFLRRLYVRENRFAGHDKSALFNAGDGSDYSYLHNKYHARFRGFQRERGYEDFYIISPEGEIVYAVCPSWRLGSRTIFRPCAAPTLPRTCLAQSAGTAWPISEAS